MANHLDLEEQEQLDQLKHFWNTWGTLISTLLILVSGSLVAWNGYQYWKNSQLIIGVTEGSGATFSLEGPEGVCFTTTSRLWTDSELEALNHPDLDPSPGKALQ